MASEEGAGCCGVVAMSEWMAVVDSRTHRGRRLSKSAKPHAACSSVTAVQSISQLFVVGLQMLVSLLKLRSTFADPSNS
jgi:hypothetical protein